MSTISPFYSLPKLSAVEAVETLSKWEGMGSTINLLQAIIDEDEGDCENDGVMHLSMANPTSPSTGICGAIGGDLILNFAQGAGQLI